MTEQDQIDAKHIDTIFNQVRARGKLQERGPTIGGMWTVDTWINDAGTIRVQLMDEGYTHKVITDKINVYYQYGCPVHFTHGTSQELAELAKTL